MTRWRNRVDRLLTWKRARTYALVVVGLLAVAWVDVLVQGNLPLNSSGTPIGGDYIAFHTAGRLLVTGHAGELYDRSAVASAESSLLGGRVPGFYDAYRNPPFFALIFAPLALLDLLPGVAIWTALNLACLFLTLRLSLQEVQWLRNRWRGLVVLILAFPPVYFGLIDGENAMVSLLLFALIYYALARKQERAAGVWAALGLFKPQLFLLFPIVFLVSRRWRSLLGYVAVALALTAVSLIMVGPNGLVAWVRILVEPETANASANAWRMASIKSFFDSLFPQPAAIPLYVASSVALIGLLVWVWTRQKVALASVWALSSLVAVLIDPHLVDYDLTVLVSAAIVGAELVRHVAWPIVLVYLVTLFRAQIPVAGVSLQLAVPLLVWCATIIFRDTLRRAGDPSLAPVTATQQSDRALVAPR